MRRVVMAQPSHQRFSRSDYHQMSELGMLPEDQRTELIEGEVLLMVPIGTRHAAVVSNLTTVFSHLMVPVAHWVQNPIAVTDFSELQPDYCLVRVQSYADRHPGPEDIYLVVEVAQTSRDFDRERKAPLYSSAGIGEYWVVDLVLDVIEVMREPGPEGYRDIQVVRRGDRISLLAFPTFKAPVDAILGREESSP